MQNPLVNPCGEIFLKIHKNKMYGRLGGPFQSKALKPEHRYIHKIKLPPHPDQVGKRDPRKVWIYDSITGPWAVEELHGLSWVGAGIVYRFAEEHDLLMFTLRWGGGAHD